MQLSTNLGLDFLHLADLPDDLVLRQPIQNAIKWLFEFVHH